MFVHLCSQWNTCWSAEWIALYVLHNRITIPYFFYIIESYFLWIGLIIPYFHQHLQKYSILKILVKKSWRLTLFSYVTLMFSFCFSCRGNSCKSNSWIFIIILTTYYLMEILNLISYIKTLFWECIYLAKNVVINYFK